jgi:hypothetical protein
VKKLIAARVADELNREPEVETKMIRGHLGELSVTVDGEQVYDTNPLWYPLPSQVLKKVKQRLKEAAAN